MSIVNREMDASQQKSVLEGSFSGVIATGATLLVGPLPWPGVLSAVAIGAQGLSGAPVVTPEVLRFIPGAGVTAFAVGTSMAVPAMGVSGVGSASLFAAGNTLLNLLAGDCIQIRVTAANTAVVSPAIACVIQKTQDIVTHYGV